MLGFARLGPSEDDDDMDCDDDGGGDEFSIDSILGALASSSFSRLSIALLKSFVDV